MNETSKESISQPPLQSGLISAGSAIHSLTAAPGVCGVCVCVCVVCECVCVCGVCVCVCVCERERECV